MTEEEKRAIENMAQMHTGDYDWEVIDNLIYKQQKEIEGYEKDIAFIFERQDRKFVSKDIIREHLKKLHITDIEPWTQYKISGSWLFELQELLGDEKQ